MNQNGLADDWTTDVITFLSQNIPGSDDVGWEHMSSSAFEMGCEALVALGQAEETDRGAIPRKDPRLPNVLPRWDDISIAVVKLAVQQNLLEYRLPDGSVPPPRRGWTVVVKGAPPPPAPNISVVPGMGPAYAKPDALSVLRVLGLIAEGRWTASAECLFWREAPGEWGIDFKSDPRFAHAVDRAVDVIPNDIRTKLDALVTISEADIAAMLALYADSYEKASAKRGPNSVIRSVNTNEQALKQLEFRRRLDLDWLFFHRWRLAEGWLTPAEAKRALPIFNDNLAIGMRRAVIARCYPEFPFLAD